MYLNFACLQWEVSLSQTLWWVLICFPSFFWSVTNFAVIAPPRHGLAAIQKPRVYCVESAPGRSEIQILQLGRCRLSDDHMYSLGAKMGFCRLHEMQLQVLKQSGIRGADLNIIQAGAIAKELSMVTWREILWSVNTGLPTDLWGLRGSFKTYPAVFDQDASHWKWEFHSVGTGGNLRSKGVFSLSRS